MVQAIGIAFSVFGEFVFRRTFRIYSWICIYKWVHVRNVHTHFCMVGPSLFPSSAVAGPKSSSSSYSLQNETTKVPLEKIATTKMNRDPLSDICTNTHNLRRGRKQKHRGNVKNNKKLILNTGRWEEFEKVAFLEGIRIHGTGKWKLISSLIPTR